MRNLEVNGGRLWGTIMETARFGGTPKGGIRRLSLSDSDREVRDWFVGSCREAGCDVTIDEVGNIFARRSGRDNTLPPIAVGSHLDTQPTGGKFDGVYGVLSGLEVVHALNDAGYETEAPLEVIDWTNEEGTRFSPPMLASGVFAGVFTREYAYARQDREGRSFEGELTRIGYRGNIRCPGQKPGAYFELHIEQGPVLEAENKEIGIVTRAQGMRWYDVNITGQDGQAGCVPMPLRHDAALACGRMIEAVNKIALDHAPSAVATVGMVEIRPNSRNVIPGFALVSVDIRHPDEAVLDAMEKELGEAVAAIAKASNVKAKLTPFWNSPGVRFNEACLGAIRTAVESLGLRYRVMTSGAGHDAIYIARIAPAAMIFVPCRGGVSHNEAEEITREQARNGANALLNAVIAYDKLLNP